MANFFIGLLLVVHFLVGVLLVIIVLMQRTKEGGMGAAFGAGVTESLFGASSGNVLTKTTVWLALIFFLTSLSMAIIFSRSKSGPTIVGRSLQPTKTEGGGLFNTGSPTPGATLNATSTQSGTETGTGTPGMTPGTLTVPGAGTLTPPDAAPPTAPTPPADPSGGTTTAPPPAPPQQPPDPRPTP